MKSALVVCSLLCASGCTPGSFATPGGGSAGDISNVVTVDVDLTKDAGAATPAGAAGGYAPPITSVAVGDGIRFSNSDGFAHTATAIAGSTFPSAYPFDSSALSAHGTSLSGGFSSGSLAAGTASQTFLADRAGTYLFGCFYHYGSPMRAEIVVR